MAAIGGVTCTFVRGDPPAPTERVATWTIPGVDGVGVARLGLGRGEFELTLVYFASAANVLAWFTSIEALVGTVVSITNDWDASYTSRLITGTGRRQRIPIVGSTACRGEITVQGRAV